MPLNAEQRTRLREDAPFGLFVTKEWLSGKGYARHSIDNLVKSGQLISLRPGIYIRPDTQLGWEGVVCSLQRMSGDLSVGGLTALELHGLGHYLALSGERRVVLFGADPLPAWINHLVKDVTFEKRSEARLFAASPYAETDDDREDAQERRRRKRRDPAMAGLTTMQIAEHLPPLSLSTPERAILEVLFDVPNRISFEHADQLMQGLATLSPRRLETVLHLCVNIRVKRLFFWFADRHQFQWRARLDPSDFDLGRGNRVIAKPGRLDPTYAITVPESFADDT